MFPLHERTDSRERPTRPFTLLVPCSLLLAAALAACGGSSHSPPPPTPTVTISSDQSQLVAGQSATLTWSSTNATSCNASGGWSGSVATSGSQAVTATTAGSVTYTLTCTDGATSGYNTSGMPPSASGQVMITVNPATVFTATNLVTDATSTATATTTDANLKNPWGLVFGPNAPVWIANNGTQTSTLYDGHGNIVPLVVTFPDGFDPTGIVFNGSSTDFMITDTDGTNKGSGLFLYSGEGGMLGGWYPTELNPLKGLVSYTATDGAIYKGLAIAKNASGAWVLYATDFHNHKVDVFDTTFTKQAPTAYPFTDPNLPTGYAPFGIQAITLASGTTQIFVTYAPQGDGHDNGNGAGMGVVDIFDTNGTFVKQLVTADTTNGKLNAPWGLALAPAASAANGGFGTLSGALLVSNFGDGKINGYDPSTGRFLGTLMDSTGNPFSANGLWGIAFGNDGVSQQTGSSLDQPSNTLFFTAGVNDEANGVYGRLDLPAH